MGIGHQISERFYRRAQQDPVLHPFFPGSLRCAIEGLGAFLTQFLGGPNEYSQRRPFLSLREAHLRFKIDPAARDAWLKTMRHTLAEIEMEGEMRIALLEFFESYSTGLVNHGGPVSCPVHNTSDHEIAKRAIEQGTIEDAVEAIRKGDAARALEMEQRLQPCFERDPAAYLSLLALMSGSKSQLLVDHVLEALHNRPHLAKERCARGKTLLHEAAAEGSLPVVELLLEQRADPNAIDEAGHAPLYFVANQCAKESGPGIVHALTKRGADVNANAGVKHCTALHMAARRGNVKIAQALLDCGADIEARDSNGDTPLRRAVNCAKPAVVALLLARGANPNSKGSRGLTPRAAARNTSVKQLLAIKT